MDLFKQIERMIVVFHKSNMNQLQNVLEFFG